jgi:phosphohistidine swiveling domain-containing protein
VPEILWLAEAGATEILLTGGKGASLGDLLRHGIPVPDGFIVTTDACGTECGRWRLEETLAPMIERENWPEVQRSAEEIVSSHPVGAVLRDSILEAYRRMGSPAVAVRSSATAEDLDSASFAGQHDSFLNVRGERDLIQAIRRCWVSLWSERALRYRHERTLPHFLVRMAVVVQQMVPAEAAGVVFTVDPMGTGREEMYVEAATGLGEGVVSGSVRTEAWHVSRSTFRPRRPVAASDIVNNALLTEVCRLALRIEQHKGRPQDIEFAAAGGRVFILQSRPITTLSNVAPEPLPPLGKPSLVDRLMAPITAERYALAPRPLDNIVFTRLVGAAIYAIREFGARISPEDEAQFRSAMWHQAYRLPPVRLTVKSLFPNPAYLRLLREDALAWWATGPRGEISAVCSGEDVTVLRDEELFARADRIIAVWENALNERFYAASAVNARPWLERVVGLAVGPAQRHQVAADLMSGLRTPTSEINDALWELSRLARRNPTVRWAVRSERLDQVPAGAEGDAFRDGFDRFLEAYGHREGSGYYLSTPTWAQDPAQVLRLVGSLAEVRNRPDSYSEVMTRYEAAKALVERRLRMVPGARSLFLWLVDRFRALDTFRETSHFDITRPLAVLQRIAAEWGRRLRCKGILDRADDVFYLSYEEVRDWILGKASRPDDLSKLVAVRRATYELANSRWQRSLRTKAANGDRELKGIPASRGIARGRARVIRDERDFHLLQPGEVLVCPYSNPAWTPLFIVAAAVVSETGGAASHAAIVAREYGIPAVMSVAGALVALERGPEVVVDGECGVVRMAVRSASATS